MNAWTWYESNKSEYRLKNTNGELISYLIRNYNDEWSCIFYNDDCNLKHTMTFQDINSPEEAIWQATLWIYKTCNHIANSLHNIRDHMPSIHKLAEEARKTRNE